MMLARLQRGVGSGLIAMLMCVSQLLSHALVVSAQVTYTTFPAKSVESSVTVAQPSGHSVKLVVKDSTLEYVINELARQAHLRVTYVDDPALAKRVTIRVINADVMDAFATALQGTKLVAKLASDNETVMIRGKSGSLTTARTRAEGGSIVGHVTDSASGHGVNGATVKVSGTNLSALTSDSGRFTLRDVPVGDQVLTVHLFGYKPATRLVTVVDSLRKTVNFVLVAVPTVLSGVVTTATGQQRKIEVGNDITSLNVDSIMRVAPITSVTDLLETRVPGLTVLHSSGVPGDPSRLRLRGAGSIQGNNDPIVIVDGVRIYASQSDPRNNNFAPSVIGGTNGGARVINTSGNVNVNEKQGSYAAPSPMDQIDPNSIETIEVFKGPSASALYGSDAGNGVIVITTKHGRPGPTQWLLTVGEGVNWLPGNWPTNYYRFGYDHLGHGPFCPWNSGASCAVDSVVAFQALNLSQYSILSHGNDQHASLTVSGGVPTLQYSVTGSGAGNLGNLKLPAIQQQMYEASYGPIPEWMVRPDNYQQWGVDGSLTASLTPRVRVTLQSSIHTSTQQRSSLENAITSLEGEYIADGQLFTDAPLIQNYVERATDNQLTSTNTLTLNAQPRSWLPITVTGGLDTKQSTDNTYIPYGINLEGTRATCNVLAIQSSVCDTTGSYGLGRGVSHDQTLTAGTAIPLFRNHVTLAVGGNLFSESTNDFSIFTRQLAPGVSVPSTFTILSTTSDQNGVQSTVLLNAPGSQSTTGSSTYGWYVEPRLNLAQKFFASPGFRLDGGSGGGGATTSKLSGLSAFPKLDLSYVAVDRKTGHPLGGVLTLLRPRVAFGYAGTQPAPGDRLRLFNVGVTPPGLTTGGQPVDLSKGFDCTSSITLNGSTSVPGVCLNTLGNTLLRPERTSELEGGFDATLWRNRVTITYSQYAKIRHDAILGIPVAASVAGLGGGSFNIEKNIGVIRNTGTELTVNATMLESRAVSWNVAVNLSNDNSLVVRLNQGQAPICYGEPLVSYGVCQGERVVAGYPIFGEWAVPIVAFADANHNGIIDPGEIRYGDSAVYVGQPNPKYQFAFNTGITLLDGRLSINATFDYQNGLTQDNQGACLSQEFQLLPNAPNTPLATEAAVVAAGCTGSTNSRHTYYGLIQTVNSLRFNYLSINYEVPKRVSAWVAVPRMTLALKGSNLGLHTNYRGKDPGVNAFSTVSAGDETADTGQIPEPRVWGLTLTLGN